MMKNIKKSLDHPVATTCSVCACLVCSCASVGNISLMTPLIAPGLPTTELMATMAGIYSLMGTMACTSCLSDQNDNVPEIDHNPALACQPMIIASPLISPLTATIYTIAKFSYSLIMSGGNLHPHIIGPVTLAPILKASLCKTIEVASAANAAACVPACVVSTGAAALVFGLSKLFSKPAADEQELVALEPAFENAPQPPQEPTAENAPPVQPAMTNHATDDTPPTQPVMGMQ
jgi:hypothetical protein